MPVWITGTQVEVGRCVTTTKPWPYSTATSSFANTWLAAPSTGSRMRGHRPGRCSSFFDLQAPVAFAEHFRVTAQSSVTSVAVSFRRASARSRCSQVAAVRIDVEPRVDVHTPDRTVVDPRHHGAA